MTTTQQQIDQLQQQLETLEDRSSQTARKIRKQIRAIKDEAGIDRPHPGSSKPNRPDRKIKTKTKKEKTSPKEKTKKGKPFVFDWGNKQFKRKFEQHMREIRGWEVQAPKDLHNVTQVIPEKHRHDWTSKPCRKCHTIPDLDRRCTQCARPLCNCHLADPDGYCSRCRKNAPKIQTSTRNLGKFGETLKTQGLWVKAGGER